MATSMRPLKLAVFIEHEISIGGNFQQALNNVLVVKNIPIDIAQVIFITTVEKNVEIFRTHGVEAVYLPVSRLVRVWLGIRNRLMLGPVWRFIQRIEKDNYLERVLKDYKVDLVYFTSQSALSVYLEQINYIYTLFDLCHRDFPEFPEVRSHGVFERRELYFQKTLSRAIAVFVDSDLGKKNVIRRYALDESRVYVMPFSPSTHSDIGDDEYLDKYIDIKLKYDLDVDYVFYPAQFWSHKNHVYLLDGIKALEIKHGLVIGAIFSGSDQDNMAYVKQMAKERGLFDRVRFAGFVPDDEMPYLYRQSIALVMPTYFGPTNLPPLEAFRLKVPVLYSDLPGLREQVADAALLMDLQDPGSLAGHIVNLTNEDTLRQSLVEKGEARLAQLSGDNPEGALIAVLRRFQACRYCWK